MAMAMAPPLNVGCRARSRGLGGAHRRGVEVGPARHQRPALVWPRPHRVAGQQRRAVRVARDALGRARDVRSGHGQGCPIHGQVVRPIGRLRCRVHLSTVVATVRRIWPAPRPCAHSVACVQRVLRLNTVGSASNLAPIGCIAKKLRRWVCRRGSPATKGAAGPTSSPLWARASPAGGRWRRRFLCRGRSAMRKQARAPRLGPRRAGRCCPRPKAPGAKGHRPARRSRPASPAQSCVPAVLWAPCAA